MRDRAPFSESTVMAHSVRIWDLPTRLFHWSLAACVIGLFISAKMGGNAMVWHLRLGYAVLALLLFRLCWGFIGGRWSRFSAFLYSPALVLRYLRGQGDARDGVGHNPLGALSVFGLLGILALQVGSGLLSDDEIAFSGPLTRFVSGDTVGQATAYHTGWGQGLLIALVLLHIAAIVFYTVAKRQAMVGPMLRGDKELPTAVPASRDDARTRLAAAAVLALASGAAWWVAQLGAF